MRAANRKAMSQHFFPRAQAWGETLGEDVEEALSFPRLEIRHPQRLVREGGVGEMRVDVVVGGGHNCHIHVHVCIVMHSDAICLRELVSQF